MITNFEEITNPLSDDELKLLPLLLRGFIRHSEDNPIKAPAIIEAINCRSDIPIKLTGPRLRKLCNHIRRNGLLPLIATSKGYFTSHDPEVIQEQIRSLRERADAILACADGLESFIFVHPLKAMPAADMEKATDQIKEALAQGSFTADQITQLSNQ